MDPSNSNTAVFYHTTVYDCQVQACKEVFKEKLPSGLPPIAEPFNERPLYDISGCDAHQVVAVLSAIVNYKDQFTMNKNSTWWSEAVQCTRHKDLKNSSGSQQGPQKINLVMPSCSCAPEERNGLIGQLSHTKSSMVIWGLSTMCITDRFFTQTQQLSQGILSNSFRTTQRLIIYSCPTYLWSLHALPVWDRSALSDQFREPNRKKGGARRPPNRKCNRKIVNIAWVSQM